MNTQLGSTIGIEPRPRFFGQDILSVGQFTRNDISTVFDVAQAMRTLVSLVGTVDLLKGKLLANLFYEPSTRTQSSFTAAMERLGGSVIPISEVRYSSVSKGESLPDTVRTLECYADVIVLRHPEKGSAEIAAAVAKKPIINAGDGIGEHPTQALLDLFTILQEVGRIDGIRVTLVGDLKYGRTVHSLAKLLTLYDVHVNYVSPPELNMPDALVSELAGRGLSQRSLTDLGAVLPESDVVYVTRIQQERFTDAALYQSLKGAYVITPDTMNAMKPRMALMHPFPRVGEIDVAVDDDPRAAYFRQMEYGMYVRMALLALVMGKA
jgi:aspartate carbamoyltransferase catalytic subunit